MKSLLRDLCSTIGPYCRNCIGAKWSVFSGTVTYFSVVFAMAGHACFPAFSSPRMSLSEIFHSLLFSMSRNQHPSNGRESRLSDKCGVGF